MLPCPICRSTALSRHDDLVLLSDLCGACEKGRGSAAIPSGLAPLCMPIAVHMLGMHVHLQSPVVNTFLWPVFIEQRKEPHVMSLCVGVVQPRGSERPTAGGLFRDRLCAV